MLFCLGQRCDGEGEDAIYNAGISCQEHQSCLLPVYLSEGPRPHVSISPLVHKLELNLIMNLKLT